jgi:hypothetical protein
LTVRDAFDPTPRRTVAGLVVTTASQVMSAREYLFASIDAGAPTELPTYVDPDGTYVILKSTADYVQELRAQWPDSVDGQYEYPVGPRTWDQLVKELAKEKALLWPTVRVSIPDGVGGPSDSDEKRIPE